MEIEINENSCIIDGVEYIKKEQKEQLTPKDGEIWYVKAPYYEWLFVAKPQGVGITDYYFGLCLDVNILNTVSLRVCSDDKIKTLRPATNEETELLHSKLAENGKRWNAEKKCLEDLPKPLKEGDIAIFYDYDKTEALIAKYVRAEMIGHYSNHGWFKNAIPFESIEQYKQFITVHES